MPGRRRSVPSTDVDVLLRSLPPIDVGQWYRDRRELDELLGDAAVDGPDDDR